MATSRTPIASDFWLPVYLDEDGNQYSDGQTGNTFMTDDPWAVVYFASMPTPGIAFIAPEKHRAVDRKPGAGGDGERLTIHGDRCGDIDIGIEVWTPAQWEALKALWPILKVPAYKLVTSTVTSTQFAATFGPGTASTTTVSNTRTGATTTVPAALTNTTKTKVKSKVAVTFDVSHPALALLGVKAVQILGARGPVPGRYPQSRVFTIKCIEYLPPGKANATKTDDSPITAPSTLTAVTYPTPGSNSANTGP